VDLFDIVDWDNTWMLGDAAEELEEKAIKYLRIEWGYHHFPHILTTCSLV
jgi:hypothetical protein